MPKDSMGNFHMNPQRARAADRMNAGKPPAEKSKTAEEKPQESADSKTSMLHDHGDGSFTSESHDGEKMEHPHIGHALMHLASKHSEGSHFHGHHDGMGGMTSHHHKGTGGSVEGPHEHDSADDMAESMKGAMDGQESPDAESDADTQPMSFGM